MSLQDYPWVSPVPLGMLFPEPNLQTSISFEADDTAYVTYRNLSNTSVEVDTYVNFKIFSTKLNIGTRFEYINYYDKDSKIYKNEQRADDVRSGFEYFRDDPRFESYSYVKKGVDFYSSQNDGINTFYNSIDYSGKSGFYGQKSELQGSKYGYDIKSYIYDVINRATINYEFLGKTNGLDSHAGKITYTDNNGYKKGQILGDTSFRTLEYDGMRNIIRQVRFDADSVVYDSNRLANGDLATKHYAGDGALAHMASYVIRHDDGSSSEKYFDVSGNLFKEVSRGADQSASVYLFKNGRFEGHNTYSAGGKLAVTESIVDSKYALVAHQSGQTLESYYMDDVLTDFGATTFVFHDGFGKHTVRGFDALPGPDHDVISLVGYQVQSFEDLNIVQVGANADVIIDDYNHVVLSGVNAAHLTADSFLFA